MDTSAPSNNLVCANCKNYLINLTCKAFPDKIPNLILNGTNSHNKLLQNQKNNIIFSAIK